MLCQNCKRNDAEVHLKRIINGESAEIHLCTVCAGLLGVADTVASFSPFGEILGGILASNDTKTLSNKILRCDTCGFTFDDIARTGRPGCPSCYRVFSQKFMPSIRKLHGRAVYKGKNPSQGSESTVSDRLQELKIRLEEAVAAENFEEAAVLRDEIREILSREGK